jgi:hypothetical protein
MDDPSPAPLPPPLDGGGLGQQAFLSLTTEEVYAIMNCIIQFKKRSIPQHENIKTGKTFFCIQVWFPADANARYNSNTPKSGFLIQPKLEENFVSQELLQHAKALWEYELVPIEIIRNGRAIFYALPRREIFDGEINSMMLMAEGDITLDDFYNVINN